MLDTYLAILKTFIEKTAGARREGAASLDLCALATGRLDGFFEFNLKPWDIAAGALIVQEAGGIVTDMHGEQTWLETGDNCGGEPQSAGADAADYWRTRLTPYPPPSCKHVFRLPYLA